MLSSSWGDNNLESHMFLFQVSSGCRPLAQVSQGAEGTINFDYIVSVRRRCRLRWASCVFCVLLSGQEFSFSFFFFPSCLPSVIRHQELDNGEKRNTFTAREAFLRTTSGWCFCFIEDHVFLLSFPFLQSPSGPILFFCVCLDPEWNLLQKETFVFPMMIVLR